MPDELSGQILSLRSTFRMTHDSLVYSGGTTEMGIDTLRCIQQATGSNCVLWREKHDTLSRDDRSSTTIHEGSQCPHGIRPS